MLTRLFLYSARCRRRECVIDSSISPMYVNNIRYWDSHSFMLTSSEDPSHFTFKTDSYNRLEKSILTLCSPRCSSKNGVDMGNEK